MNWLSNKKIRFFSAVILGGFTLVSYQNCAKQSTDVSSYSPGLSQADVLEQKALKVLANKCSSCHNSQTMAGGIDVMNVDDLLASGVLIPAEPSLSPIFTTIQNGTMPPSGSLRQTEIQAVFDWVTDGFTEARPVITAPPPGIDGVLEARWMSIQTNILLKKCASCHSGANPSGGISYATYASAKNSIQPTLPLSSSFYTSVAVRNTMPRGGDPLTAAEKKVIFDWITAGALYN